MKAPHTIVRPKSIPASVGAKAAKQGFPSAMRFCHRLMQSGNTSSITATSRTKARHRRSRRDRKYCTDTWAFRRGRPLWSGHCGDCQHQQRDANVFCGLLDVWKLVCKSDQPEEARHRDNRILHRRDRGEFTQKLQHDAPLRSAPAPRQSLTAMQYNLLQCEMAN